jgi:hypothetical protein
MWAIAITWRPASVCKLFKKSSPLKLLGQFKPNLAWIILRGFPLKVMSDDPADQPSWPPCLLIEHRDKIEEIWRGQNGQHSKIYLPCNFEVNLITHLGVIALFSSNLYNFNTFRLIFQKCAACQDLPTLQFWSKFHYLFWSYCPFFIKFSKF